jgi:pSer/pThr/pTyr-binding forkhead associated (FHA) protein
MYKLVIQDDEGKTTVVPLIRDELTIGRKEGNTIRLTERNVSRQHARLTRANGTIVIEDLNSYNGIRVNGSRIDRRATIKESDRVQIGDYLIEVRSDAAVEAASSGPSQDETQPLERIDRIDKPPPTVPTIAAAEAPAAVTASAPEAVALADTDPGRVPGAAISNHGRLVILSTNFAGQEFVLDKPRMVVGRTDDNDIWLNHRSISRHHAKVVFENGRYAIEDLQSSNGVRVNGEEYGKVELRRADVVDLGHVRLRFVEPGEDFVFGRDAQPVEVYPDSGGRTWLWVGLSLCAVVGAVAIFLTVSGGDNQAAGGENPGTGTAHGTAPASVDAAPVATRPDAASVKSTQLDDEKVAEALARAKAHLASQEWDEASRAVGYVLAIDPDNAAAKQIEAKINVEVAANDQLKQLEQAAAKDDFPRVRELAGQLASTSRVAEAVRIEKEAKRKQMASLITLARRAARNKDCSRHRAYIAQAAWSDVKRGVRNKAGPCKAEPVGGGDSGTGAGTGAGTAPPRPTTAELRAQLDDALLRGNNIAKGYEACDRLGGDEHMKLCALLSCQNQSKSRAQRYYRKIRGEGGRMQIRNSCGAKGIFLQ